jgi:hypothetical protein
MSSSDSEIAAYSQALVQALRATDVDQFRQFATTWGARLGNRGLKQLAKAPTVVVERRMWMMIYDRPDLADLHPRAEAWLAEHEEPESPDE